VEEQEVPIGRVAATENKPNTAELFYFWTNVQAPVGIGTIVRVVGPERPDARLTVAYGVVTEGYGFTDLESPLHDFIGAEGDPASQGPTERPEIRYYSAAVLRINPEEPLQPVPMGQVYQATELDVVKALRMDEYYQTSGIPIGLYQRGGVSAPVYLDANFLLGPEAAHLNSGGASGLATKTSAIEFIVQSVFTHYRGEDGVAAVCFNVKGPDLMYLDLPPEPPQDDAQLAEEYRRRGMGSLSPQELEMYRRLGVPPEPFQKVRYFAPYKSDQVNLNTVRTSPELRHNVSPLRWGLREIFQFSHVLLNRDDIDAKADALLDFIAEKVIDKEPESGDPWREKVEDFTTLARWFEDVLRFMEEENKNDWRTHNVHTIRKIRNRLSNFQGRSEGLLTNGPEVSDLPWDRFEDRTVYVIDVANLGSQVQDLVFTRVVSMLTEALERNTLGVRKVMVFVDELNKYAAGDSTETYLKRTLLDIA